MRNLKKFLSLLLAVMMIATAGIIVSAEDEADYTEAVEVLKGIGVLKGYGDGNFGEKDSVTRIQMALLVARMMESKYSDEDQNYFEEYYGDYEGSFNDMVTEDYDYSAYEGAANYCDIMGIVKGVSEEEKIFNPTGLITLDEAIAMVCRALGYDSKVWPVSFRIFANEHGILTNLETVDWKDSLTREETAQLLYNMINVLSGNDLGAEAWPYAGEHFADFVNLEKRTTIKDCVLYTVISNNKVDVYTVPCTKLTTDKYDVLYDSKLNEVEEKNAEYAYIVCYELYDGTVAGVYVTGKFNGKFNDEAAIEYEDGNSVALTVSALRYNGTDKDGKIILADSEGNETAYVLDAETVKTLTKNSVYYWALNEKEIVAFKATNPTKDLGILTGIEIEEDENGEYTGNFVATVLRESTGFKTEEKISVRSIYSEAVKYKNEWADNLDKDLTIKDIITRDNAVYEAYTKLFGILEDASWLVEIELDELGAYDLSVWETYHAELITVNEYATDNVLSWVDGMTWNDSNKNGVIDNGELTDIKEIGACTEEDVVLNWVGKDHQYDAEGKYFTFSEDVTYVVVNNYTGKVEIFQNEPTQGQWLCGDYAYKTLVNEAGYCVVVVDEFTGPFDLEPRATYVQVEDLAGWSKMNKSTFELGGYKIPLYTFDYTISGMTTPNGEVVDDIVFEGLTEAQHSALKTEMSIWNDYVVENEFIYRLHTNEGKWTEEIVPFMYFDVATWAEYWEEYDVYEATMDWVDGSTLLNHQDKMFEMFDLWYVNQKKYELTDYAPKYEDLEAIAYLDYTNSEAISKYYTYDVGLTYDEDAQTLYVHYEKVGVWVEAGEYRVGDKWSKYALVVNMPGYGYNYDKITNGAYIPFGSNIVAYEIGTEDNVCNTCGEEVHLHYTVKAADEAYIKVAGKNVAIDFKDGVPTVHAAAEIKEVKHVSNKGYLWLGNMWQIQDAVDQWNHISAVSDLKNLTNNGINENAGEYIYWDGAEDMTVSYQQITTKFFADYVGDPTENKWAVSYSESIVELDKWDYVNVAQLKIEEFDKLNNTDTLEQSYIQLKDDAVEGKWYTYGTVNTTKMAVSSETDLWNNVGYYDINVFDAKTEAEFLAQFKDGKVENGLKDDVTQTIFKYEVTIRPQYIDLYLESTCNKDGEVDKATIAFIDAVEVVNGKPVLRDYDEDFSNVYVEDDVTGIAKVELAFGTAYVAHVNEVKHVCGNPAHAVLKVVINDKRVGTVEASDYRYFSTLSAQDFINDAEAEFMVGATLAYSTLVKALIALRKAIIGA